MEKCKLAFLCALNQDTFIEPIVKEFEKLEEYQVHRYYTNQQADIIAAVKWCNVIVMDWANEISIYASQLYEIQKKSVILRLHSYEALSDLPKMVKWEAIDYLVFVAEHIKEIVKQKIPDIEERVCTKVIPNGLDMSMITKNTELNPFDIAYVCNINHKKEPALALQIMAELVPEDPDYKLHVAGAWQDERYKIYMEHMAREMGIEDNIIYYGFVQDMDTFWEGKGVILSTSIHEGHPYNIMEGAARGLRPVVHNFMGARDLYPTSWLFNTVNEAVEIIEMRCDYTGINEKQSIIDRGWTLENQINQFKVLVEKAGEAEK
jgi:glycosyltransferase involved in cell wall biosynthesis